MTWLYSTILNSTARGWSHSLLAGLSDSDFQAWFRSVLGASDGYLQPGTAATGQIVGFDPYGQFAAAEGFDVYLEGLSLRSFSVQMAIMRVLLRSPAGMSCR